MKASISSSQRNGKTRQFIVAVIVNLLSMAYGISVGWPSPIIPQLHSTNPPIGNEPLSDNQISWINSLLPIGGLLTIPFCGVLSERLGRKKFAQLTGLPYIISWLLIVFGNNYNHLLVARLFVGMGGAMTFLVVPLYVSEIASEDIRGLLGSLLVFSLNVGILIAYVAGACLSYKWFASVSLICPVVFVAASIFIPETPVYLIRRNRQFQAHKSLMFFRGNNEVLVEQELISLQSQVNHTSNNSARKIRLRDVFRDRATRKGLIISIGLLAGQQFSGIFAMISYAETIFKRAGSSISAETASIMIAVIQIIGSSVSTMLMERAGRRLLTLISCSMMSISHVIVGLFFYLQNNHYNVTSISWLPLVALSTYIVNFCLGIGPVPLVVISEVFNLDVSSLAATVCLIFYWIIVFTGIRMFDFAMLFLGAHGCFLMLASFCAICFVFTYCLLPETKGRKREDIIDELAGQCDKTNDDDPEKNFESKVLMN